MSLKSRLSNGKVNIYRLIDPVSGETRYVGKTVFALQTRFNCHIATAKRKNKRHVCNWIRSLLNKGAMPIIDLLEEANQNNWAQREMFWILEYHNLGANLTNHSIGGEGGASGVIVSEETRTKIGNAHKGKVISDEQKRKQSEKMTGRKLSEEHKIKVSLANIGKKLTNEHKYKISKSKIGKPQPKTSGTNNGRAILLESEVKEIKKSKLSLSKLADQYGMSKSQMYRIRKGEQWKSVKI